MTASGATPTRPERVSIEHAGHPAPARPTARIMEVRTLPPRWFPADKDKLVYLAVAAHVGPQVLGQLAQLPAGVRYEDRRALLRAVEAANALLN